MANPHYGWTTTASGGASISDHGELTAPASGAVELAEVRAGPNSASTTVERLWLQRKSATMTGSTRTPSPLSTRSPAKAGTYKDTASIIGTASGSPIIILAGGRPNDQYGGWSAPRPNARIALVNAEILGMIQSLGSGHNIIETWVLAESGGPLAPSGLQRIARRSSERGYWSSQRKPYIHSWWSLGPAGVQKLSDVYCRAIPDHPELHRYRRSWNVLFDTASGVTINVDAPATASGAALGPGLQASLTSATAASTAAALGCGLGLSGPPGTCSGAGASPGLRVTLTGAVAASDAAALPPTGRISLTGTPGGGSGAGIAVGLSVSLTAATATEASAGVAPANPLVTFTSATGTATGAGLSPTFTGGPPATTINVDAPATASGAALGCSLTAGLTCGPGAVSGAGAGTGVAVSLTGAVGGGTAAGASPAARASLTAATATAAGAGLGVQNPQVALTGTPGVASAAGVTAALRVTLTSSTGTAAGTSPAAAVPVQAHPSPAACSAAGAGPSLRATITSTTGTTAAVMLPPFASSVRPANQYGVADAGQGGGGMTPAGVTGGLDAVSAAGLDSYTPRGIDGD